MTTDRPDARAPLGAPALPAHATRQVRARQASDGRWWALVAAAGAVGFVLLSILVASHVPIPLDQGMLRFVRGLGVPPIAWQVLSESANIPLIVIGLGIVAWLLLKGQRREAVLVFLMLAAVTAGSEGVKQLVARPRPSGTDPNIPGVVYSYPSGHVLEALTILGIITIRSWRSRRPMILRATLVVLVGVWVVLVGVSRIGLAAHYPSDVLAGVLGGAAALGIYGLLTRRQASPKPDRVASAAGPRTR